MAELIADLFTVKNDNIPETAWPKLSCGVANELTFEESSLKLGDQREVFFQNSGQLRATADLRFLTGTPTPTEKLRILATGNIGIGTTIPKRALHVEPSEIHSGGSLGGFSFGNRQTTGFVEIPVNGERWVWYSSGGVARLWSGVDKLVVTPGGNVGIGTLSPTHVFHVLTPDAVGLFESTTTQAFLRLSTVEGLGNRVEITNRPGGRLSLFTSGAGDAFNITRNGMVGIGTIAPIATLDVRAANNIKLGLEGNGGGQLILSNNLNDNKIFLEAFSSDGSGSANELLLTGKFGGPVPRITLAATNTTVTGHLSKASGSFRIDHPLDPENKYLYHSFVESPDMMNVYNGNVVTDENGEATVTLPPYFEALNCDFRYQLTVIGRFAQAIIASTVRNNRFTIKADQPQVEVSWQVTGIRRDAYANAYRIQVEEEKPPSERGHLLHPEAFGQVPQMAGADVQRSESNSV